MCWPWGLNPCLDHGSNIKTNATGLRPLGHLSTLVPGKMIPLNPNGFISSNNFEKTTKIISDHLSSCPVRSPKDSNLRICSAGKKRHRSNFFQFQSPTTPFIRIACPLNSICG
uniref:Uncharacterized protein n=1 Tax=Cacopsylla melanoneura TaxID=428564 RepID=A0A8D9B013_9HEMI